MSHIATETLVLGGGLAGSMVALELARKGRQALVLERSKTAHHKMCGEFLSEEAIRYLARHGVDPAELGGVRISAVRMAFGTGTIESKLPFSAYSLTRAVLDEELLNRAAAAGADIQRNSHAESLSKTDGVWHATLRDSRQFYAKNAFLATGKHDLRGWPRPAGKHRGLVAFKMYYQLTSQQHAALGDTVELILFPGGYAGLQPVEGNRINLCLLVTGKCLKRVGVQWECLLPYLLSHSRHLETRLDGATALLAAPLTAAHIPYGHMQRSSLDDLWRVGDQAAVIPSFCGDGMAMALHSGALAARSFLNGDSPETYRRQFHTQLAARLKFATHLSQLIVGFPTAAEILRLAPELLARIASMTRIPNSALISD
jgi:flavin-dependent dehydrogenase